MNLILRTLAGSLLCLLATLPVCCWANEIGSSIDASRITLEGTGVDDFVPPGWTIEEQASGDLNKDSLPDIALKLIEDKPVKDKDEENLENRRRVLIILFKDNSGKFSRVAVADRLLQGTCDGGAFHMFCTAPANVKIEDGILIVNQDRGSRNVVETTFRFRYDAAEKRFVLIGLDRKNRDRLNGGISAKSTNFLTGEQIIERSRFSERKGDYVRKSTVKKRVPKETLFIEQVDHEKY